MALPLESSLKVGVNTMLRRTEPATGPWMPTLDELVEVVQHVDRLDFDFLVRRSRCLCNTLPRPHHADRAAAVVSKRLIFRTAVFLLPLRHPRPSPNRSPRSII